MTSALRDPPTPPLPAGAAEGGAGVESRGVSDARERILRAAYDLFCRNGIHATGIDRIVAEAGVAKMTLYRHFGSKHDLVRAVLDLREELWTHGWLEYEVERRRTTPVDGLLAVFDVLGDWFRRDDYESCLFLKAMLEGVDQDSPVFESAVRHQRNTKVLLRKWAEEAGAGDPEALAHELQMLMGGAIVLATRRDADAARRARGIAELLLDREGLHSEG